MKFRDYQLDIYNQVVANDSHDLIQLDTGGGKTPILAALGESAPRALFIAHRNVLISQISGTLSDFGLTHGVLAAQTTVRRCVGLQRAEGLDFIQQDHPTRWIASIDSVLARHKRGCLPFDVSGPWWVLIDEAHHVLRGNKWGRLADILPDARFIGCTATPCRLDGHSLHKDRDGLFDRLVQAESLRSDSVTTLIRRGYLSDFRVYSIGAQADESLLRFSAATGDYTLPSLISYTDRSTILGDAVKHYQRLAPDRQAVAMCVTIQNAEELAEQFRAAGIAAACVSSRMGASDIARRLDAFQNREIKVLTNVDMVGEGFDVPGIEALLMCRKTASLVAYRQWIGRALRPSGQEAVIVDHVGNVLTHGLPDTPIVWSLHHPPAISRYTNLVACPKCSHTHFGWLAKCPECGEPINLRAKGVGKAYVDLRVVDVALCEYRRKMIEKDQQFKTEVLPPPDFWDGSAVDQVCRRLRHAMLSILKEAEMEPDIINRFTHDQTTQRREWWINRFTIKDLTPTNGPYKFIKEFKKWQSTSSTATPQH